MKWRATIILALLSCQYSIAQWNLTSPMYGGTVNALAYSGGYAFAGTDFDGIFRSSDDGASWVPVNNGITDAFVKSLHVTSTAIYAAAWDVGVLRSQNYGGSWVTCSAGLTDLKVNSVSSNGSFIFAVTNDGVFRSSDEGVTWKLSNDGLPSGLTSGPIFNAGGTLFVGTSSGPYRSTNNGTTWSIANNVMGAKGCYAFALKGSTLFAGTATGVYATANNGDTWTAVNGGMTNALVSSLVAVGSVLYAGTQDGQYYGDGGRGVFRSTDDGQTWTQISGGLGNLSVRALAANGAIILAGTNGSGAFRLPLGGTSWIAASAGMQVTYVRSLCVMGGTVFAGSGGSGLFRTTDGGASWQLVNTSALNTFVNALLVSDGTLFMGTRFGVARSTDGGNTWLWGFSGSVFEIRALAKVGSVLFAGTYGGGTSRSTDLGVSWVDFSSGLTNLNVRSLCVVGTAIYAGTAGGVFRSTDAGVSWTAANGNLADQNIYAFSSVGSILFAGTLSGVYRSSDNGNSWTTANSGLTYPSIRALYASGSTLFAGTTGGVFVSTNVGDSWVAANTGLVTTIYAFAESNSNLFVGTYRSGGIWRRPLSELLPLLPPVVSTSAASSVTGTSATLAAIANPAGSLTTAWFEWGTTPSLTSYSSTTGQSVGSGTAPVGMTQVLGSLYPNTTYYYRVAAQSAGGTVRGSIVGFTTLSSPPGVSTYSATSVSSSFATLNGAVNPVGSSTTAWFEWSTSASLASYTTTPSQSAGNGNGYVGITHGLSLLSPATTYYYRMVAQNTAGTVRGAIANFTTSANLPSVTTQTATGVSSNTATLSALVNPSGASTTAWFEWGASPSLTPYTSSAGQAMGSSNGTLILAQTLASLSGNTTYYYRVAAQNAAGTVRGAIASFTTSGATVIRVPADFSTIQGAVNAASASGIVLVSPGTYTGAGNRNIVFGKNMVLRSTDGPLSTILDCELLGRAFLINQGESNALTIDGFTLKNCLPTSAPLGYGAAMFVSHTSAVTMTNCIINGATMMALQFGDQEIAGPTSVIKHMVFKNNTAGCIHSWKTPLLVDSCLFEANNASGPALVVNYHLTTPIGQYTNCILRNNTGSYALFDLRHGWKANNCLVYNNVPVVAVSNTNSNSVPNALDHCTAYNNGSTGSLSYGPNSGLIASTIFWPTGPAAQVSFSGNTTLRNSVVPGGISGAVDGGGNIQADPRFADAGIANFRLGSGSPCIGTGQNGTNMGVNMEMLPQEWLTGLTGSIHTALTDAEDWGSTGAGARVDLYDNNGSLMNTAYSGGNSTVTFSSVPQGSNYSIRVFPNRACSWGEQFWGEVTGISVVAGQTTAVDHKHNTPYMPNWNMYIDATNENLPAGGRRIVPPGTRLRIDVDIKNPSYPGSLPVSAYAGLHLDRDTLSPYDATIQSLSQNYAVGSSRTISFYWTAPNLPGDYLLSFGALASSSRYPAMLTDGGRWIDPPVRVEVSAGKLPPWTYTNSGIGHIIIVPLSAGPSIMGIPLTKGDHIGVFYDSLGTLACAGYERWTDSSNIAITAFGDDQTSPQKDGFTAGESFSYKIFRAATDDVYPADPSYASIGGIVTHGNAYATNGISQLNGLAGGSVRHTIALRAGWGLISSFVAPQAASLDSVFQSVRSDVVIVKNSAFKSFIPSMAVNTIGYWVSAEGYQIKMAQSGQISIRGQKVLPGATTISLPAGWSIMPYVRETDMPVAVATATVTSDIILLKDQDGRTYIPSIGINSIGSLKAGQGYQVKLIGARSLQYPVKGPAVEITDPRSITEGTAIAPPWSFSNTGSNHTVIIPISANLSAEGLPLASGDFIGVFYDSLGTPACAGYEQWNGTNSVALAAFGDDPTTTQKDGLVVGEVLRWKIWRQSNARVFTAYPSYLSVGSLGGVVTDSSRYNTNGISGITSLAGSPTSVADLDVPKDFALYPNYPNPFNPSTTIGFSMASSADVTVSVYNVLGEQMSVLVQGMRSAGYHTVQWNARDDQGKQLTSGVYLLTMRTGAFIAMKKMLLVK